MRQYGKDGTSFPILIHKHKIIEAVRSSQVVIVAGETGCGKTTHLPLFCHEAAEGKVRKIAVTQPRRIAAISLSRYVGHLSSVNNLGVEAGYKVRFSASAAQSAGIVFMTDGILLSEIAADPLLTRYGAIIIDEAHERTLNIDFLLGYLRRILPRRPDLRLIIASATMDTKLFSKSFRGAPVIRIEGRLYPIEIRYEPVIALWKGQALRSYVAGVAHAVIEIVRTGESGDILAFLPTVEDIEDCARAIRSLTKEYSCVVCVLYGRMAPQRQEEIFRITPRRKIVLATNIAETSLTVPNIRFVIDTGVVRRVRFDSTAGINRMPIEAISQAEADQRAGRCGRVADGVCIRLYSQTDYNGRSKFTLPEIRRANLAGVLLRMASLGIGGADQFAFVQRPHPQAVEAGYRQLRILGALDGRGRLTELGRRMARLPLDPAIARMLLHAGANRAFNEAAVIAAALSVGELWSVQSGFSTFKTDAARTEVVSDFSALLECWRRLAATAKGGKSGRALNAFCEQHGLIGQRVREWMNIYQHLIRLRGRNDGKTVISSASRETVHKSLLCAFTAGVGLIQENGLYRTEQAHDVAVSPGSMVHGKRKEWILFHEIVETKRPYGRYAAEIKPRWIQELFPMRCHTSYEQVRFDAPLGRVMCLRQVTFNGLPLIKDCPEDYGKVRPREAHEVFIKEALVNEQAASAFGFLDYNRNVRRSIELVERKMRTKSLYRGDVALAEFYSQRLPAVASIAELNRQIGRQKNDGFLRARVTDLTDGGLPDCGVDYPDRISVAGLTFPVYYAYAPDSSDDGATVRISREIYEAVPVAFWEWLLPVFYRKRIESAMRINTTFSGQESVEGASAAAEKLKPGAGHFIDQAALITRTMFGEDFEWTALKRENSLWLRVEVANERGIAIESFRPPFSAPTLPKPPLGKRPSLWKQWCGAWERDRCRQWEGNFLDEIAIQPPGQLAPIQGFTGFELVNDELKRRIFFSKAAAIRSHCAAVKALLEKTMHEKIAWAWHDFVKHRGIPYQVMQQLTDIGIPDAAENLFTELAVDFGYDPPKTPQEFESTLRTAEDRLVAAGGQAVDLLSEILPLYFECARVIEAMKKSKALTPAMRENAEHLMINLENYLSKAVHPCAPQHELKHVSRYLKAFVYRVKLAREKPLRYKEYAASIDEFLRVLRSTRQKLSAVLPGNAQILDDFEEAIEEYAIDLFTEGKMQPRFFVSPEELYVRAEAVGTIIENEK